MLATDIILDISSQEHLIFTSLHIDLRLFELFSKEVRVKKQAGMPLNAYIAYVNRRMKNVGCSIYVFNVH